MNTVSRLTYALSTSFIPRTNTAFSHHSLRSRVASLSLSYS